MSKKIIECVPNFSEGRSQATIDAICAEIKSFNNVKLLDVDMGYDTNRTVVTFAGHPNEVVEAAFKAIKKASDLIDMRLHNGAHPRMGATDVCPIIPIIGVSIKECVNYSLELAKKVGENLNIPIFLYEHSAKNKIRKNLANIRSGEYELMSEKISTKDWKPDFGPQAFNEKAGVTAIGVRDFLIAYNVNINTSDKKKATDIALDIREKGRAKRDASGKILRDKKGQIIKIPGSLKSVKAVGWYIDEYNQAQVSMNLTDYKTTSIHEAFEEVRKAASKRGLRVTGSEIVGLVPKQAMIEAGIFYLKEQKSLISIPEKDIIDAAIISLGLNDISSFDSEKSIIENSLSSKNSLSDLSLKKFIDELSRNSPAPGGGSVSALAGSLSSALISMVINLSTFKNSSEYGLKAQELKDYYTSLIQEDTEAFDEVMSAFRMKKKTPEDQKIREQFIIDSYKKAISPPLEMLRASTKVLSLIKSISGKINKNCLSDLGVAIEMIKSCSSGAVMNVDINLKEIHDKKYKSYIRKEVSSILEKNDSILLEINKK